MAYPSGRVSVLITILSIAASKFVIVVLPSIATGTFVYQSFILESKNWGPYIIAQSFMVYSIMSVITLFISGLLIDKFTSRKILVYMNIRLLLATAVSYTHLTLPTKRIV